MPKVSVIIPSYNRADLITETVNSVLAQTYKDFELIIVDDGSTDATLTVLKTYGDAIHYIKKENGGQGSARNVGIKAASGEYIAFLDSDDLWHSQKLEKQMEIFKFSNTNWVYCDMEMFDSDTKRSLGLYNHIVYKPHEGFVGRALLMGDFIGSPTPIIRKNVFEHVGYFDESEILRCREDWEMWLRIAAHYPVKYIRESLSKYRVHSSNSTLCESILQVNKSEETVIERAIVFAPRIYGPLRNRAIAKLKIRAGRSLMSQCEIIEARKFFTNAILCCPPMLPAYAFYLLTFVKHQLLNFNRRLNFRRKQS